MITIKSNAKEVSAALREISRLTPRVANRVINTVGMALRKDVQQIVRRRKNPHGIQVEAMNPLSRKIKRYRGQKATLGGKLPKAIRYRRQRGGVFVGVAGWGDEYMRKYQTAEERPYEEREQFLIARATRPDLAAKHPYAVKNYVNKTDFGTYRRPARPVFEPLANSPQLAARIRDSARRAMVRMADQAARKARAA